METAAIAIRIRGERASESAAQFVQPLLLPYLTKLVGNARLMGDRGERKLTGRDAGRQERTLEIEVTAELRLDLDDLARKLEKFLKVATAHAGMPVAFDVFQVETFGDSAKAGPNASL